MIRVLLVDDHELFCQGMCALLAREPDLSVVGSARDVATARSLFDEQACDVAVIDISLPGAGGISLVRELRRELPHLAILMLSMHDYPDVVSDALARGATGYALKSQSPQEISDAIRTVAGGQRYLAPPLTELAPSIGKRPSLGLLSGLSAREREVFDLLVQGQSNQAISSSLFISVKTVETHRMRLMRKLSVHSIGELIRLAVRHDRLLA